jgi:hypothetical protein
MATHTNPPGHLSPNPFVHCLIVVLLLTGTRRLDCFRPPGLKIAVPKPPPGRKFDKHQLVKPKLPSHPLALPAPVPAYIG